MNKIVVPNYPVEKLPADLRQGLMDGAVVTVTVDGPETTSQDTEPLTFTELFALIDPTRPAKSTQQIVNEIRALREEWD